MSFRIADRNRRGGTITINKILINKTEKMKVKKVLTLAIIAVCSMGMVSCTAETKNRTSYGTGKDYVSEEVHEC